MREKLKKEEVEATTSLDFRRLACLWKQHLGDEGEARRLLDLAEQKGRESARDLRWVGEIWKTLLDDDHQAKRLLESAEVQAQHLFERDQHDPDHVIVLHYIAESYVELFGDTGTARRLLLVAENRAKSYEDYEVLADWSKSLLDDGEKAVFFLDKADGVADSVEEFLWLASAWHKLLNDRGKSTAYLD